MRRFCCLGLALALILSILLVPGCAGGDAPASPVHKDQFQPLLGGASDGEAAPDSSGAEPETERTQQYGTPSNYVSLDGTLVVRVAYPTGDIAALEEAICGWAEETAAGFRDELNPETDNGSFNGNYDSYEVDGQVVSVRMTGTLSQSHASRRDRVCANFHADRATGALLHLTDLLCEGGEAALEEMALSRIGDYP